MNSTTPSINPTQAAITLPPAPNFKKSLFRTLGWASLICMLVWGWIAVDIRPGELATGGGKMYEMIFGGVTPRDLRRRDSFLIRGQIFHFIQAGIPGRHIFMKWS